MIEEIIKQWKDLGESCTMLPCPRCGHVKMEKDLYHNALSRRADIYICPACGTEEALEDFCKKRKKPLEEWFLFTDIYGKETSAREDSNGDFVLRVNREVLVTRENVDDIMCMALEGGITYWCNKAEVIEDEYYGEYASEQISRGGSLRLFDSEEDEVYELTLEKLLNGIRLACREGYGEDWFDGYKLDDFQIDGDDADTILQYAIFGEQVYG